MFYIILFTLIGLFVVLNLVASIILAAYKSRTIKTPFLKDNYRMDLLKQVMPEQSEEDIKEIVRCFSSTKTSAGRFRMVYAPFTEHKDIPFSSEFLNVSHKGFRLNSASDTNDPEGSGKIHVFLFGGSTTLGYGVKDADTIAAHLERRLNKDSSDYRVFNCGRQSYFSTLEVLAFQRFLQERSHIDIAVFIDGLNDVFHNCPAFRNKSRYSEHIEKFWNYIDYLYGYADEKSPWMDSGRFLRRLAGQMPLMQLAGKIKKNIIDEFMRQQAQKMRFHEPWASDHSADEVDIEKLAQEVSKLTLINWEIARGISHQFNIRPIFCLQPVYYMNMPLERHLFLIKNEHPLWEKVYKLYYQYISDGSSIKNDFIDLSAVFKDVEHCPYIDSHHYSPYGNKLIAEAIVEHIINIEK